MKLIIFGLAVSSSWGNGHATLWRGLCAAMGKRGHTVVFFERDQPFYANTRDVFELPGGELILYSDWAQLLPIARKHVRDADVAMVTSYCPDALTATSLILNSPAEVKCFYDLDTPVTLDRLESGLPIEYIGPRGLIDFDLTLSYTGGRSLEQLQQRLGARATLPLYGSVDPTKHFPVSGCERYRADLSYLGTFAKDRQAKLETFFGQPASLAPQRRFVLGGAMYGSEFPWQPNIYFVEHVPASEHPAFYCSARLNLNVTRQAMAENGYCPSGRLFEAAACGATVLTDYWEGLENFFEPATEILITQSTQGSLDAIQRSSEELRRIGLAARERVLAQHTADVRAQELEAILSSFRVGMAAGVN